MVGVQNIDVLAQELFEQAGGVIPTPVVNIAKSQNLEIFETELDRVDDVIPSGILTQTNGRWSIFLNINDSLTRKRFTIAHELGHFLLHKNESFVDDFPAGESFYRDGQDTKREQEANRFAACLLMPEEEVRRLWPLSRDPKDAAQKFQVSEVSMTYRLKNLSLIEIHPSL